MTHPSNSQAPMPQVQPQQVLAALEASLHALRGGQQAPVQVLALWRERLPQLASLPSRSLDVASRLLSQMESGALFSEESCSFSQADLCAALAEWLDHARLRLQAG